MNDKPGATRRPAYFEKLYDANPDPWNFAGSDYEQAKYRATIDILEGRRFRNAYEAGCSIGVFTKILAAHCDSLLACDIVETALAEAKKRCEHNCNVTFKSLLIPRDWPCSQKFDLIVLSEILYFMTPDDIIQTARLAVGSLLPGGVILLVNYTAQMSEPCGGNEAAECFIGAAGLPQIRHRGAPKFRLDLLG